MEEKEMKWEVNERKKSEETGQLGMHTRKKGEKDVTDFGERIKHKTNTNAGKQTNKSLVRNAIGLLAQTRKKLARRWMTFQTTLFLQQSPSKKY